MLKQVIVTIYEPTSLFSCLLQKNILDISFRPGSFLREASIAFFTLKVFKVNQNTSMLVLHVIEKPKKTKENTIQSPRASFSI